MPSSDEHPERGPADTRAVADLTLERALALGEEARAIARLQEAGLRAFEGHLVDLRPETLDAVVARIRAELGADRQVLLRPFHPTSRAALALRAAWGDSGTPIDGSNVGDLPDRLAAVVGSAEVRAAFGGSRTFALRVIPIDAGTLGRATSTDPIDGNPDLVGVARFTESPYRVERKSGRVLAEGEGLISTLVEDVADLVDRAHMILGRPVTLEWALVGGRPRLLTVSADRVRYAFAGAPLRRVALVAADEGCVAPLAIDALDRGLSRLCEREAGTASRVYARAYRRLDVAGRLLGSKMGSVPTATSTAAKVAYEAAVAIHADSEYCRGADETCARLRLTELTDLADEELLLALDQRHALVSEAFARLDASRELTRRAILALEIAAGPLPRECYPALSSPKHTRERAKAINVLAELGRHIGSLGDAGSVRARLDGEAARRWDDARKKLAHLRPLGIDLVAVEIGASDASLHAALSAMPSRHRVDAVEEARWAATRRVLGMAQSQPLGAARAGVVSSVSLVLDRIVASKGRLAESLASGLGLLRCVAVEVGRRLCDRALLDAPADALYLTQAELEDALRGEPSGLAARVRSRREDDERWRNFDAPRRLVDEGDLT